MMITSSWFSSTWVNVKAVGDSQIIPFLVKSPFSVHVLTLPSAFQHAKARLTGGSEYRTNSETN